MLPSGLFIKNDVIDENLVYNGRQDLKLDGVRVMITVSAAEFQKRFGLFRNHAQREPVMITSSQGQAVMLLSVEEYRRLKCLDRESFYAWELSDEDIEDIAQTEPPADTAQFDHELNS